MGNAEETKFLVLAQTCHKAFGESSRHIDWLHNGDVCRLLNIQQAHLTALP